MADDRLTTENDSLRRTISDLMLQAEAERIKREIESSNAAKREALAAQLLADKDKKIADLSQMLFSAGVPPSNTDYPGLTLDELIADSGQAQVYKGYYRGQVVAAKIFKAVAGEDHLRQYRDEVDILMYAVGSRFLS